MIKKFLVELEVEVNIQNDISNKSTIDDHVDMINRVIKTNYFHYEYPNTPSKSRSINIKSQIIKLSSNDHENEFNLEDPK